MLASNKYIVDSYGGFYRHGGGAFSGKDPSKVDRSGAYFCRYVARQLVLNGYARRAEVQVSYAIGRAQPVSFYVETFGTGDQDAAARFVSQFDFRPASIIAQLGLLAPIYRQATNYGHFGKPELPWETDVLFSPPAVAPDLTTLDAAYRKTTFQVDVDGGLIYIRPSVANPLLDCLLAERDVESWAYITAHNPGSQPLTAIENETRHAELIRRLDDQGYTYLPGRGIGDTGLWPPEESLLVLDISETEAAEIGALFGQNAILVGRKGDAPRLVYRSTSPDELAISGSEGEI